MHFVHMLATVQNGMHFP